jgi:hypothetical protein
MLFPIVCAIPRFTSHSASKSQTNGWTQQKFRESSYFLKQISHNLPNLESIHSIVRGRSAAQSHMKTLWQNRHR